VTELHVIARNSLSTDEAGRVLALAAAAAEVDGVRPLSEQTMLALRAGRPGLLAMTEDTITGYAYHDEGSAELVVHPERRRHGHGRALAMALRDAAGERLRVWAHGDLPAAAGLAAALGWSRLRSLWQLRRPLDAALPDAPAPPEVRIRTFAAGRDEEAWLAVNRRAFATHPEQGRWTVDDVLAREREPWFDPAGFFLAERAGSLVGFHWTKVHEDGLGEVYVVGVDPAARGLGLGRVLTVAGLNHLRARGLPTAMLYVDEENVPAVKLYESLGFRHWSTDVMYGV
jgi:mycothiol synthase